MAKKADASLARTSLRQPYVDRITTWLRDREDQNGFGEDFEYTLRKKRTA